LTASQSSQKLPEKANPEFIDLSGNQVLIVEDHHVNQIVTRELLLVKWKDLKIDIASNGKIAIDMVKKKKYDIILMDILMPEMNGYEATQFIRESCRPPVSDIPILAMTAFASKDDHEKCLNAGMNDYLSKPFTPDGLYLKVTNLLAPSFAKKTSSELQAPPEDQPSETRNLDLTYFNSLTEGNSSLRSQVAGLMLKETPEELALLQDFFKNKNWDGVQNIAHKLKSSQTFMGLHQIGSTLNEIENSAMEQTNLDKLGPKIEQVFEAFSKGLKDLKKLFK
jgi:hypothetical protein